MPKLSKPKVLSVLTERQKKFKALTLANKQVLTLNKALRREAFINYKVSGGDYTRVKTPRVKTRFTSPE